MTKLNSHKVELFSSIFGFQGYLLVNTFFKFIVIFGYQSQNRLEIIIFVKNKKYFANKYHREHWKQKIKKISLSKIFWPIYGFVPHCRVLAKNYFFVFIFRFFIADLGISRKSKKNYFSKFYLKWSVESSKKSLNSPLIG